MHSSRFTVKGFSCVTVIHHGDWSGEVKILTFPEGLNPDDPRTPHEEILIPDGILPALFKSAVREFLRVTAEEAIEKILNFAGRRNPWR
jgi:hypothetical protein